jgi:hypothetical protein
MTFTAEELKLIISSLEADKVGTWGDGRGEAIDALLKKLGRRGK